MFTYDDLVQQLTSRGGVFEIETATVSGRTMKVFKDTPQSLNSLLELARPYEDAPFLTYHDRRLTFQQVLDQSDHLATALFKEYGIKPKDRIAIAMRNIPEWIIAFKAIVSLGCTVIPLNAWWTAKELRYGLVDSGALIVLCDEERARRLEELRLPPELTKIVALQSKDPYQEGVAVFEELLQIAVDLPSVKIALDDDVTILYTSGTTGNPKGAVSTNRSTVSALIGFSLRSTINAALNPQTPSPPFAPNVLIGVPLFHITGCMVMLSSFISGVKVSLMHHWDPVEALKIIEQEHITSFVGVPTMSWDILEASKEGSTDLSSLQSIGGGGSPVPPKFIQRVTGELESAVPGFGYGLTETNAFGPGISGDDLAIHPTSTGRVLPIIELRIVDPNGKSVPPNTQGEICMYGVPLVRGYWNKEDQTQETFAEGWLRTGDLGYLDEDGYLYIQDRIKDVVIRGGENIYCVEVEAAIYEHPSVHEVAVFGVPDARLGEKVAAQICTKKDHSLSDAEIQRFLSERIAYFKVPEFYYITEEPLARGATGKILKRTLREQFQGSRASTA